LVARVAPVGIEPGDPAEVDALAASLRATTRGLAGASPGGARLLPRIDGLGAEPLADLVMANLSVPVSEKARYAEELRLVERVRIALALAQQALAARG
jgi:hypothetical protein